MIRPRIRIVIEVEQPADFDRKDWQRYLASRLHPVVGGELIYLSTEEVTSHEVIAPTRRKEPYRAD